MMLWITYFLIAAGYEKATGKFWASMLWPIEIGKMIARVTAHPSAPQPGNLVTRENRVRND